MNEERLRDVLASLVARAVEAWKQNDDEAMDGALDDAVSEIGAL